MERPLALRPPPAFVDAHGNASAAYRFVRRLGVSPSCEVLLAVHAGPLGFERMVVVKRLVLPAGNQELERTILREAMAYARLSHPAVVRLHDFFRDEHGRLSLALEHVDGVSLSKLLASLRARGERHEDSCAKYVALRVFSALAAAHTARDPITQEFAPIVHRDVSPGNVLLPWDGYAKLADFGIARLSGLPQDTRPGVIKGTDGYMAPEQLRGGAITPRTDVYSGCLLLRELLTGEACFPEGSELARLRSMAAPTLSPLDLRRPDLSPQLLYAMKRGLTRDEEHRSITADEMAAVLRAEVNVDLARAELAVRLAVLRRSELANVDGLELPEDSDTTLERDVHHAPSGVVPRQTAVTSRPPALSEAPSEHGEPHVSLGSTAPLLAITPRVPDAALPMSPMSIETPQAMSSDSVSALTRAPRGRSFFLAAAAIAAIAGGAIAGGAAAWKAAGARAIDGARPVAAVAARPQDAVTIAPSIVPKPIVATSPRSSAASPPIAPKSIPRTNETATIAGPVARATSLSSTSDRGSIVTDAHAAGHRIYVDGRVAGAGGGPLSVRCGRRVVKIGSAGRAQKVDVPCGGEITVSR